MPRIVLGHRGHRKSSLTLMFLVAAVLAITPSLTSGVQAQGTVSGRVTDAQTGAGLAAVQVHIPGPELGVLSNADGTFSIANVPAGQHTVRAQRLGYRPDSQDFTLASGVVFEANFQLQRDVLALDELVVTGTPGGTQRRALGNVIERLDAAAIREVATVTNVEQMLSGRMAGVNVLPGSGMVGGDAAVIRIRGTSSIGLSNEPIVYVDGVRINTDRTNTTISTSTGQSSRLNDINPEDIESIEVIKGPAAATLYGTEASNGVIQIITRRGVSGAPVFDASAELGFSWMPDPLGKMSPTYGSLPGSNELLGPFFLYEAEKERFGTAPFGYGPMQRYNVGVRGGTDLLTYSAAFSRSDVTGIVDWNWDRRWSARASLGAALGQYVRATLNSSYISGETRQAPRVWQEFVRGSPISAADFGGREDRRRGYRERPIEVQEAGSEDLLSIERAGWSLEASFTPAEWLRGRAIIGTESTTDGANRTIFREIDAPRGWFGNSGLGGRNVSSIHTRNHSVDLGSTATLRLTDDIGSSTSVGAQYNITERSTLELRGTEFLLPTLNTVSATGQQFAGEDLMDSRSLGVYIQQEFDWNQRRFLTLAVRGDDHSAFGANFSAAIYPKISGAWVIHEESFWREGIPVTALRLRGAWGAAGQQPAQFASTQLYQPVTGTGDRAMITPFLIGNPDLGPETGEELELGFDASLFDGRVDLIYTWYTKTTKDAIVARWAAPSLGFPGRQFVNVGEISNWGHELGLDMQLVRDGPVQFSLGLVASTLGNRIERLGLGDVDFLPLGRFRYHAEGFPIAGFHAIRVLSAEFVSGNSGAVTNAMCDGGLGPERDVGMKMGGSPVPCADAPQLYYGRGSDPTWSLNITPRLTVFERFDVSANVGAQGGGMAGADWIGARHTSYANSEPGLLRDDPIFMAYRQIDRNPLTFYKTGFAKLRDVSVAYRVPERWIDGLGASRMSVVLAGRNLATLWQEQKFTDIGNERVGDPEAVNLQESGFPGEARAGAMPALAQGSLTVRVTF